MPRLAGQAVDGKVVNELVKRRLAVRMPPNFSVSVARLSS